MSASTTSLATPSQQLAERLDDPVVAASLGRLLDHADLLSTLVGGLHTFVERGDTIVESVAAGVHELRGVQTGTDVGRTVGDLRKLASSANDAMPVLQQLLDAGIFNAQVVSLLSMVADAAVDGAARAQQSGASVAGVRGLMRTLKDPDVQRGLGLFAEIARSVGRHLSQP